MLPGGLGPELGLGRAGESCCEFSVMLELTVLVMETSFAWYVEDLFVGMKYV